MNYSTSFKGFSNIISAHNVPIDDFRTSYFAMKLNDDDEYKDLTKYKQIRKELGYPNGLENEDILTLTYITDGRTEDIYLGEKGLCWGEQLLNVRNNFVPRLLSEKKYNNIEALHLKIYTFLASLTKRMSYDKFENEDENVKNVIETIFKTFQKINKFGFAYFNKEDSFELTSAGALKLDKFQKIAKKFNRKIAETMTEFFR